MLRWALVIACALYLTACLQGERILGDMPEWHRAHRHRGGGDRVIIHDISVVAEDGESLRYGVTVTDRAGHRSQPVWTEAVAVRC